MRITPALLAKYIAIVNIIDADHIRKILKYNPRYQIFSKKELNILRKISKKANCKIPKDCDRDRLEFSIKDDDTIQWFINASPPLNDGPATGFPFTRTTGIRLS